MPDLWHNISEAAPAAVPEERVTTRREWLGAAPAEVASAVVYALPGRAENLRQRLAGMPGVEIHAQAPDGRLVVTVESCEGASAGDTRLALHLIEEVLSVALVSHYAS